VRSLLEEADLRGFSDLANQLRRSTASIPANILEAAGEWRIKKRLHYLMIAKGSTWESWAHTDSMVDLDLVPEAAIEEVRDVQNQITALLITTIRNLEASLARNAHTKRAPGRSPEP
jgi:four helix bundle protein